MAVAVRRAGDRFRTVAAGRETWHAFSFGDHYDPAHLGFGLLVACNEERLAAGTGYPPHEHRGLEIVTWLLDGTLVHEDSTGHRATVGPGMVQRLYAGSGVSHSERAADDAGVTFLQMWLVPDEPALAPEYGRRDVTTGLAAVGWVGLVGAGTALALHQRDAALHATRLATADAVTLPSAPDVYLHVVRGSVELEGTGTLAAGDAAAVTAADRQRVTAREPAELLAWAMHATAG